MSFTPHLMEEEQKYVPQGARVRINVGGTNFDTYLSTLTRINDTMLSAMVAERWRNAGELFVDRDPTLFAKILEYLRDGDSFTLPQEDDAREALCKEAEFYNIPSLAEICVFNVDQFNVGDRIQWRESLLEVYWEFFVRYQYDRINYPQRMVKCMACGCSSGGYIGPTASFSKEEGDPSIVYEDWLLLKHHMQVMKGTVTWANEQCCNVKWSSELELHHPKSALRLSN